MLHKKNKQDAWKKMIWILLAVIFASFASAEVVITNVEALGTIIEGQSNFVSFSAEDLSGGGISYEILLDGNSVALSDEYLWQTDYSNAGNHIFTFIARTSNSSDNETRTIVVEDDALEVNILSPEEKSYNDNSVTISATTDRGTACNYELNNSDSGALTYDGTIYSKTITFDIGAYELIVSCSNTQESNSKTITFEIDQTLPTIVSSGPSNSYSNPIQGSSTTIHVETNEDGSCKYDSSDKSFDSMSYSFSNLGSSDHYAELNGLSEGKHIYYVRCQDIAGNKMTASKIVSFYTNKKPTAAVDIKASDPLKAGRYEVVLATSEAMQSAPLLQYNFHNDASKRTISLTGEGRAWKGYLIIESSTDDTIGTFYFTGTDLSGLVGTEVTDGKLFLIDTTAPPGVDSFQIEQKGDLLRLEWHYVGEEAERFNIYRSMSNGVSLIDFHAQTGSTVYEDDEVEEGVTYFYKVTVEDEAGNEGPLSEQKTGMVEPELIEAATLSPSLSAKADQRMNSVESAIIDIDWSLRTLSEEKSADTNEAITKLSLMVSSQSIKNNLQSLKNDLEKIKNLDLTEDDFNKRISRIDSSLKEYESQIIKSIEITNKLEYEQSFDQNTFREELNEYALYKELENNDELVKINQEIQEKVTITSKILAVHVNYLDSSSGDDYTIITKTVTAKEPISGVSIVEKIPKSVEDNAENIKFSTTPRIIQKDPVVEWEYSSISSNTIYYVIFDKVDVYDAKKTITSVFVKSRVEEVETEAVVSENNQITGAVPGPQEKSSGFTIIFLVLGTITIVGLLVYYLFFIKEESEEVVQAPTIVKKKLSEKTMITMQSSFTENLAKLIHDANQKSDEMDFSTVHKLYQSIIHLYSATVFASDYGREQASAEVNKVYSKLLLFNKMRTANILMAENRIVELKIILDDIERLLKLHEDESGLFYGRMKILHDHLSVSSIALGDVN